jgi:hypothetical protein
VSAEEMETSASLDSSSKRTKNSLSLKQKIELIKRIETAPPHKKRRQIAEEFGVAPSTISCVVKNKDKLKEAFYQDGVDLSKRRFRKAVHEDIDSALYSWFKLASESNVRMSGPTLVSKAEELAAQLGKTDWKCTEGWLYRFRKRHGVVYNTNTGSMEPGCSDEHATAVWRTDVLIPALTRYDPRDVFCMDECGIFWRLLPDRTVLFESEKCHGGQNSKERLTVVLCANMAGTEKWPLVSVGKFTNPQSFEGIKKLPVLYEANERAWINQDLFHHWLRSFDSAMKVLDRKVLLVLNSSTAHQKLDNLSNLELLYLPINTGNKYQAFHGMAKNFKVQYR